MQAMENKILGLRGTSIAGKCTAQPGFLYKSFGFAFSKKDGEF